MTHEYETFATSARTLLRTEIYTNASHLITELVKNAEHHREYIDELYDLGFVQAVAEGQYRILEGSYSLGYDSTVRVVEVTEVDQEDLDVEKYIEVSFHIFAEWLWASMTETAKATWLKQSKVVAFDSAVSEHQDMLFCRMDAHPATASGLLPYLKQQQSWPQHWTLLDEGDDPEMTDHEVYEHWIVSRHGKAQLESVGEKVVEVLGLNIWCRTTTGQTIWYDHCMEQLGQQYLNQ
jgi:hypothetical protein